MLRKKNQAARGKPLLTARVGRRAPVRRSQHQRSGKAQKNSSRNLSRRIEEAQKNAGAERDRARHREAQLHHIQVMYQHLFESTPDANIIINDLGTIVAVNHQTEALFGYQQNEMVGQAVEILVPEARRKIHGSQQAAYMHNPVARPMAASQALRLELAARRKNGSVFPTEITLNPVKVESGLFVLCVVRDVSQREQHERELHAQYDLVHLLQDIAVASNEATSLTGAIRYALNRMNRFLGWALGHAYLIDDDGIISATSIWTGESRLPGSAPRLNIPVTGDYPSTVGFASVETGLYQEPALNRFSVFKAVSESLRFHHEVGESADILDSGLPVWLNNLPDNAQFTRGREARQSGLRTGLAVPILAGRTLVGVLEFFHTDDLPPDPRLMAVLPHIGMQVGRVVERYRSEEALRKAATQLRMVMTNLPVILWVIDREGTLLMIEGKEIQRFQADPEIVPGKNLFELFDNRQDMLEPIRRALSGEEIHTEFQTQAGTDFESYLTPYYDANWAVDGVIGLSFNISERKRMEFELAEMRRRLLDSTDSERANLASQLHDGPLQDLYGAYYQIQETRNSLDEANGEMLDRAMQTIRGVNATLRVICGELHPSTLVHLGVEKAIRSHAARLQEHLNGTTLHLELQADPPDLSHTLRLGLYRTYQQLVDNAVQHAAATQIQVRLRFLPQHVILEVQDNGQGFENPTHWVELVRQGKLGLVSTLERVQSLNGQLQIETSPGSGTLVTVSLPVK